ncbi:MAG: Tar ligand binding domain-containing protein [Burkholderiaceae bacterium]|nr:Tar ligand binding domain-containing protein [Burkholderiaceae bacterium]
MKMNLPVTGQEQRFSADKSMVTKTNTKGIITFANQDFVEVSGFSEEELVGKNHNLIRHPDMPPVAFEIMWKTLKRGLPWRGIVKNRCKNGDHYWVDARIVPIKKNGEVTGYMSVRSCPTREDVAAAEAAYESAKSRPEILKEDLSPGWKKHLSIKNGIPLWIAFVTLLMIGGGVLGITGLNLSKADIQALYHKEMVPVQAIQRINFLMADNRTQLALALNFKFGAHSDVVLNNGAGNNHMQAIATNKSEINRLWASYIGQVTDAKEQQLASTYIQARNRYVDEGLTQASQAVEEEDYLQAQRVFFNQVNPLYDTANTHASALLAYLSERAHNKLVDTTERGELIFKMAVAGITLSCLVLIVAGFFFFRITARPLEKAVLALENIAEGKLSDNVDPSGYGEPGRVMTAVMATQMHLKVMLHEIRQSSGSIHQQCNQLNRVMMDLAEHSDEQQERIYQTVDAVKASRTAMTAIAGHMDALLEAVHAGDNDNGHPALMVPVQAEAPMPAFELMPAELMAVFGDSLSPPAPAPTPEPAAQPVVAPAPSAGPTFTPAPTDLGPQVQTVASEARSQALAVEEVSSQLHQVARLIVQNREDVQGAWAASQRLEHTARELDALVKYFD